MCVFTAFLHHGILQSNMRLLNKDLTAEPVVEILEQECLLSDNDVSIIKNKPNRESQVQELVRLVQWGSKQMYEGFLAALASSGQESLLQELGM